MSRTNRASRFALLCSASVLSMAALALPSAVLAQDPGEEEVTEIDEVVVTGIRAQLRTAQAIKQNSEVIVDSITAVDIGALPDRSVSEALQRISGVTLQRTNEARDPARLAAEGGGVFIRGLSWVRSETNGRDIFSARNGRGLSFEDVSADLLAGVDVYKNPAANQIEGGIGGTVNLRTRLPFDQSGRLAAFSADYNYGDMVEEGYWSGSALFSDRWMTNLGEIGLLANISYSNVGNRTNSITTDRFDPVALPDGSTVYHPKYLGWRDGRWEQERKAVALAVQWRPVEDLTFTLQGFYSEADPTNIERVGGIQDATTLCPSAGLEYDNGVLTGGTLTGYHQGGWGCWPTGNVVGGPEGGTFEGITYDGNTRYGEDHKTTGDYSLSVEYSRGGWDFSGDIQYVESVAEMLSFTVGTQRSMLGTVPLEALINVGGSVPSINILNGDLNRPQDYYWGFAMDHIEDNEANSLAWRGDATYNFENSSWLRSLAFGYRGTDKTYITRQSNWNWGVLSAQYWGFANDNGGTWSYPAVYLNDDAVSPGLAGHAEYYDFGGFFRGDVAVPGGFWLPSADLVSNGTQYANSLLNPIVSRPWPQGQGWGWSPLVADWDNYNPTGDNPTGGVTEQNEETQAFYGFLRFGNDTALPWPVDGNLGLRYVRTETATEGRVQLPTQSSAVCTAPTPAQCADYNDAVTFSQGGVLDAVPAGGSYDNWLPSLNIRAHLSDDLQLRFAASRAMVRPDFNQMQPYTQLAINFEADGYTLDPVAPFTGTAGNPNLRPIMADQFDVSLEWYFAPQNSITGVVFYKKIKDYIYSGVSEQTYTNNGVTYTFDVTQQMNGEEGTVKGFEIAYQQFFDFLPGPFAGFGVQANYTYIESDGGRNTAVNIFDPNQIAGGGNMNLPLEGMSPTSYNVAGLYERGRISARLAWNWRERYLLTTSAANINAPVWSEDYGQLDGSIFFSLTDDVKLGLQATNLTKERTVLRVGAGDRIPRYSWVDTDRRIAAVLRARF
jgi:TonB-dependent receptor